MFPYLPYTYLWGSFQLNQYKCSSFGTIYYYCNYCTFTNDRYIMALESNFSLKYFCLDCFFFLPPFLVPFVRQLRALVACDIVRAGKLPQPHIDLLPGQPNDAHHSKSARCLPDPSHSLLQENGTWSHKDVQ